MSEPSPIEISPSEAQEALAHESDAVLLDCRRPEEHAIARVEGAVLLPMAEIPRRLAELESSRGSRIVVMCHHGVRSLRVAFFLRQAGFEHAQSMAGGIERWASEIDPTIPRYSGVPNTPNSSA